MNFHLSEASVPVSGVSQQLCFHLQHVLLCNNSYMVEHRSSFRLCRINMFHISLATAIHSTQQNVMKNTKEIQKKSKSTAVVENIYIGAIQNNQTEVFYCH